MEKFDIDKIIGCDKYNTAYKIIRFVYMLLAGAAIMFLLTALFAFLYFTADKFNANRSMYMILMIAFAMCCISAVVFSLHFFKKHRQYLLYCEEIFKNGKQLEAVILDIQDHSWTNERGDTISKYSIKYEFFYNGEKIIKESKNIFGTDAIGVLKKTQKISICYNPDSQGVLYLK